MLRRGMMAGACVLLAAAVAAAADVDGRWQGSVSGPNGDFTITYNLKAKGATLTGTAETPNGEQPISDGKVDGNKISFKTHYNDSVIDHEGTVSGDTMQLKVSGPFGDFDMTLKRVAPSSARPGKPTAASPVPPYHAHPPRRPLPQVLPWRQFAGNPWAENAYRLAERIRPVLYQQPCYCWCSRNLGHACLLDCFTRPDKHAAVCQTCLKEAFFAYAQTERGVSAGLIRAEIIRGDWAKVDLAQYSRPPAP